MKKKHPQLKARDGEKIQKRNTHSVNNGLEDAIALLWDILDEAARSILFIRSKVKRVAYILKVMRGGPHSYGKHPPYKESDGDD